MCFKCIKESNKASVFAGSSSKSEKIKTILRWCANSAISWRACAVFVCFFSVGWYTCNLFSSSLYKKRWCVKDDFAAVCKANVSSKILRPTASRCLFKSSMRLAAAYMENSSLFCSSFGKYIELEPSKTIWQRRLVSSSYFFENNLSVRPKRRQSIFLVDSPGLYKRCSANSTEKPWKGLLCIPVMKPSTTCLASNSRFPKGVKHKRSMVAIGNKVNKVSQKQSNRFLHPDVMY